MLIAHLSDCHIAAPGKKAYGVVATDAHLRACVEHINGLRPRPDVALVTGDITYSGSLNEAAHAREILGQLEMPFFLVPGNHDDRQTLWQVFAGGAIPERQEEALSFVVDRFPIRLIGLDSTSPGNPGGEWSRDQDTWLRAVLDQAPERPSLLFFHHPPLKFGVLETDEDGFTGADRLGDTVAGYRNILALACGHIHLQAHALWQGTVVSTALSMGLHLVLDLTLKEPSRFVPDVAGYQLHFISSENRLVSHSVMLGAEKSACLFEE